MDLRFRIALRQFALASFLLMALLLLWILVEFFVLRGTTPEITDEAGRVIPESRTSLEWVRLGGVNQAILIRGHDTSKPLLLFLHGGPGMPAMFLAHAFQRDLERAFMIVHWDRRGAGKSYSAGVISDSLTVRQTLEDLYELTRLLRRHFYRERIYLTAHSWGTYLGVLAVQEHPEFYSAYIGMGQLTTDTLATRIVQRRFLYNMAKASGDHDLLRQLVRWDGLIRESDLFRYGAEIRHAKSFWPIVTTGLWAPEYDLYDAINVARGATMVTGRMIDDVRVKPLNDSALNFNLPVFFFLGRYDYVSPSVLAEEYYLGLSAPMKNLVWFERSAHFPFWEEPGAFTLEMIKVQDLVEQFWKAHTNTQ